MTQKWTQKGQFEPAGLGKLIEKQFSSVLHMVFQYVSLYFTLKKFQQQKGDTLSKQT
jgi:hypothetical protein